MTDEANTEAGENGGSAQEPFETLRQAAKAVAAAAAVGAAVGAARAFTSRNDGDEDADGNVDEEEQRDGLEAKAELPAEDEREPEEDEESEPEAPAAAEHREPEPEEDEESEPEAAPAAEHHEPEPPQADRSDDGDGRNGAKPVQGESLGETTEVVRRAREQLRVLQQREPESISSLERTDDGWAATFELVELARVPNSMDVMASYEIVLDEQKNMVRYTRTRRYYRAQSDREGGP